jgi:A/G-specific adenine glycosylase
VQNTLADTAIEWFDDNARDLPWRHVDATPWSILVSEIMLQQTPVNRVLPVWLEWMRRWPTPGALAADRTAEAIRAWGRLGYPRRALRLHACAVAIVEHHAGIVPADVGALLALPGIGTYTANAVAAFAYGQRQPVVDTNVRRFVARAVTGEADAGPATSAADLRAVAALLPEEPARAARASAAFMEIGALICVARTPVCGACPVTATCAWRRNGSPAYTGPVKRPQGYAGTDRQIRGALMAVLRDSDGPVGRTTLDLAWPEAARRDSALASLIVDGLACEVSPGVYALAGDVLEEAFDA